MNEILSNRVLQILKNEECTIPSLCEKTHTEDEYKIMEIVGNLETLGKISLKGFKSIYREDGGHIRLAVYGSSE